MKMNKRSLTVGSAALLVLTLLSAGIVSATPPTKIASCSAKVTPGHPGGSIQVRAKVLHPDRTLAFSASAVTSFSGTTIWTLKQSGKSYVAVRKIQVPTDQTLGPVTVTVSIVGCAAIPPLTSQITAP